MNNIGRWLASALLLVVSCTVSTAAPKAPLAPLQNGHVATLEAIDYSPDGRFLATSDSNTTRIWNAENGRLLHVLRGGGPLAWGSGQTLAVGTSASGTSAPGVRIWNAGTGQLQSFLRQGSAGVAFSADGKRLACGWKRGFAVIDVATAKVLREFEVSYWGGYLRPALSADGSLVTSANVHDYSSSRKVNTRLEVRRVSDGTLVGAFKSPISVKSFAFSPDGTKLAIGQEENTLCLWEPRTNKSQILLAGSSPSAAIWPIYHVQFSPDGARLYSTSDDGTTKIWDTVTGDLEKAIPNGYDNFLLAVRPDGKHFVGRSGNVLDENGDPVFSLAPPPPSLGNARLHPNGRLLAMEAVEGIRLGTDRPRTVQLWDLQTLKPVISKPITGSVNDLRFEANGTLLATVTQTEEEEQRGELWTWAAGTRQLQGVRPLPIVPTNVSPDGNWLASLNEYLGIAQVINSRTGQKRSLKVGPGTQAFVLAPTNRGVSVRGNGQIDLWNLSTGASRAVRPADKNVNSNKFYQMKFAVSPRGTWLTGATSEIILWDLATGKERRLPAAQGYTFSLAFSPDEKWLATGNIAGDVLLWQLGQTPQQPTTRWIIGSHNAWVSSLVWAKDGRTLFSFGGDGTIKQWNSATRSLQATVELANGHTQRGYRVTRGGAVEDHLTEVTSP